MERVSLGIIEFLSFIRFAVLHKLVAIVRRNNFSKMFESRDKVSIFCSMVQRFTKFFCEFLHPFTVLRSALAGEIKRTKEKLDAIHDHMMLDIKKLRDDDADGSEGAALLGKSSPFKRMSSSTED